MDQSYSDDDLVYVDPDSRSVIGPVQWSKSGSVKPIERPEEDRTQEAAEEEKSNRRKGRRKRTYPWGTYRAMRRQHGIRGKEKEIENYRSLDEALTLAMEEPFWD